MSTLGYAIVVLIGLSLCVVAAVLAIFLRVRKTRNLRRLQDHNAELADISDLAHTPAVVGTQTQFQSQAQQQQQQQHPKLTAAEIERRFPVVPFSEAVVELRRLRKCRHAQALAEAHTPPPDTNTDADAKLRAYDADIDLEKHPLPVSADLGAQSLNDTDDDDDDDDDDYGHVLCTVCQCTIGVDDFGDADVAAGAVRVRVLPCGHCYHAECIASWLRGSSNTCPTCMHVYKPEYTSMIL